MLIIESLDETKLIQFKIKAKQIIIIHVYFLFYWVDNTYPMNIQSSTQISHNE